MDATRRQVGTADRQGTDAFAKIASANHESYTLYEIAQAMGQSMSLTETMTLVSSKLSTLVPFSSCALFVRSGEEHLRCRFATGLQADLLENATIARRHGLSGWVAPERRWSTACPRGVHCRRDPHPGRSCSPRSCAR